MTPRPAGEPLGPAKVLWSAVFPVTIVVLPEYETLFRRMWAVGGDAVVGFSSN